MNSTEIKLVGDSTTHCFDLVAGNQFPSKVEKPLLVEIEEPKTKRSQDIGACEKQCLFLGSWLTPGFRNSKWFTLPRTTLVSADPEILIETLTD